MKTITIDGTEYDLVPKDEALVSDWRLPTTEELLTLVKYEKYNPASDLADTASSYYWSSTTYVHDEDYAFSVHFYIGNSYNNYKSVAYYVRCVKDGKHGLEWSASSNTEMDWHQAIEYAKNLEAPVYYKEPR